MFTGIIEDVGRITAVQSLGGGRRLTIATDLAPTLSVDESVSVNGACQTVVAVTETTFDVVAVEETLLKTTLGDFEASRPVNLERAMRADGRLDGHLVLGHVDATGTVVHTETQATSWLYRIRFDAKFAPYLIPVGSIAVDGVSLTVARLEGHEFTVSIIPHTYENTAIPTWATGKKVNLEFDMIGKYVLRALSVGRPESDDGGITKEWLQQQGFGS